MENEHRLRFAPSPTGGLHIGTARTALFNWLAARSMQGKLILRIEDTDSVRSKRIYERSITEDLQWLGIDWDEFYRQSERLSIYREYAEGLVKDNKAYYCFCSQERLENLKRKQYSEGSLSKYDNRCRNLSGDEIKKNIKDKIPYAIRFKVLEEEIIFKDVVRGEIRFSPDVFGDFVILKSDNTPSYNFAVVIDDWEMKITHVLRGEDHITNTARQIMLFKSLGFKIPEFAHLSMILGKDGRKLSKRHGSQTIGEFKNEGYLNEAIVNYLALLSWSQEKEIFLLNDILNIFRIEDISKSPAIFDIEKLNWINSHHIRSRNNEQLFELVTPFLRKAELFKKIDLNDNFIKVKLQRCIDVFKDKIKTLKGFKEYVNVFFDTDSFVMDEESKFIIENDNSKIVIAKLQEKLKNIIKSFLINGSPVSYSNVTEEFYREMLNDIQDEIEDKKIKGKDFYMPIRACLTGKLHGPEIPKIMFILGNEECLKRINIIMYSYHNIKKD